MRPLRVIRERVSDSENEFDLRGLGHCELFTHAAPFARLVVALPDASPAVDTLLAHYGLTRDDRPQQHGVFYVHTRVRRDGDHKLQAISLFVAGVELALRHPTAKIALIEVSPLHHGLHAGIRKGGVSPLEEEDRLSMERLLFANSFGIESAVTRHLSQAGFPVGIANSFSDLDRVQLSQVRADLLALASASAPAAAHSARKAG